MKEFRINEYLSLRLENGKTIIYVGDEKFRSCKYLLINIEKSKVREYDNFESIDEAIDFYSNERETNSGLISPETEFWGHCSNLQAWAENNYDTRILEKRLAFPLLRELSKAGDLTAKRVFKEEVARRIKEGYPNVIEFLLQQHYLDDFTEEEKESIFIQINFSKLLTMKSKMLSHLFNQLLPPTNSHRKKVLRKKITEELARNVPHTIYVILNNQYLDFFQKEEKNRILRTLEPSILLDLKYEKSFPLLKKLNEGGNSRAKAVLKKEILRKLRKDDPCLKLYLVKNDYLHYFSLKELNTNQHNWVEINGEKIPVVENSLDLSGKNIHEISNVKGLFELDSLKELDLRDNHLSILNSSIENLNTLRILDLSNNNFSNFPKSVINLTSLEILHLKGNKIDSFPDSIGDFHLFEEKRKQFRDVKDYQAEVLIFLEFLTNKEFSRVGTIKMYHQLEFSAVDGEVTGIGLQHCNLGALPWSIGNLTSIERLYLYDNEITKLPEAMVNLTSLKELDLCYNDLIQFPEIIGNLTSLRKIWMSGNDLEVLPESIGTLQSLVSLDLRHNNLKALPKEIGILQSLEKLDLRYNNLKALPKEIGTLQSIKYLDLEDNDLKEIPESIKNLISLEWLNIRYNDIETFPKAMKVLEKQGTKLHTSYEPAVERVVRTYKNSLILKILVVGEGGVGRTTMLQRYFEKSFNPGTKMTIGVNFYVEEIKKNRNNILVQFWDLAGQERWRFFQKDFCWGADGAIITFDLTRPLTLDRINEWVDICRTYNHDLPILLLGAKLDLEDSDRVPDEYIKETLLEQLDLFDYLKISSKIGENVNRAINLIVKRAKNEVIH